MSWDKARALKSLGLRSDRWSVEMRGQGECEVCHGQGAIYYLMYPHGSTRAVKVCRDTEACEFRKAVRS